MGVEIERKFLVADPSWRDSVMRVRHIIQGYFTTSGPASVRVRITDGDDTTLTIKSAEAGVVRREFAYRIPRGDAEQLFSLCAGSVVEKLRHEALIDGLVWEIDVYLGANAGLVVAEVELEEATQPFERPPWLGEEITGDPRYYNAALAQRPFTLWPRPGGAPPP